MTFRKLEGAVVLLLLTFRIDLKLKRRSCRADDRKLAAIPSALFGVLRAGMIAVNVNPLATPRVNLNFKLSALAQAIVIVSNFASTLEKVVDKTRLNTLY